MEEIQPEGEAPMRKLQPFAKNPEVTLKYIVEDVRLDECNQCSC